MRRVNFRRPLNMVNYDIIVVGFTAPSSQHQEVKAHKFIREHEYNPKSIRRQEKS
jgi:hypothetical protein